MSTPNRTVAAANIGSIRREQVQGFDPLLAGGGPPVADPLSYLAAPPQPPSTYSPAPSHQTPPLQFPQRSQDSIDFLADGFLKNCVLPVERQKGVLPKLSEVPPSIEGLRELRNSCSWQELLKLTQQMLSDQQLQSAVLPLPDRDAVLAVRFEALFRTKMFDDLQSELSREIDSFQGRHLAEKEFDCLFSYRLLLLEVRILSGNAGSVVEDLLAVQGELVELEHGQCHGDESRKRSWHASYWRWATSLQLVNSFLRLRQWRRALLELRSIQRGLADESSAQHEEEKTDFCYARVALSIRLVRLLLQIGDKKSANAEYESAVKAVANHPALTADPFLQQSLLLVQGLLQFAEELYETAAETFSHLLDAERMREAHSSRGFLLLPKEGADFTRGCASRLALTESRDESLLSAGVNNLCLCLLHLKQNHTAIARLEALIGENPPRFMSDAVVFNLCTMYDLSYSPDASQQKKKVLQKVATRFGLVDPVLHWRSFRAT